MPLSGLLGRAARAHRDDPRDHVIRGEPVEIAPTGSGKWPALLALAAALAPAPAMAALFSCDHAGLFAAIAAGNAGDAGPHTFDCSAATTVELLGGPTPAAQAEMTLDGGGLLSVSRGAFGGRVLAAIGPGDPDPTIVLRNLSLDGGRIEVSHAHLVLEQVEVRDSPDEGFRLLGDGTANLRDSAVLDSAAEGFSISGNMTRSTARVVLTRSAVIGSGLAGVAGAEGDRVRVRESLLSGNAGSGASGDLKVSNSTVSGNGSPQLDCAGGLFASDQCEIGFSTIVSNGGIAISFDSDDAVYLELVGNLIDGACEDRAAAPVGDPIQSLGSNVEGPGDTCDLDAPYDLSGAFPAELGLGPLQDNGGPTETHALLAGAAALGRGVITSCPAFDQRGVVRPDPPGTLCDSGAFEDPTPFDPVVFSCDYDGLFEALSFGNAGAYGPHTFDCTGPTTIDAVGGPTPAAQFDMEIDGGGLLTIDRVGGGFAVVAQGEVPPAVVLRGLSLEGFLGSPVVPVGDVEARFDVYEGLQGG